VIQPRSERKKLDGRISREVHHFYGSSSRLITLTAVLTVMAIAGVAFHVFVLMLIA
jgi:hypothetical protein